MTSAHVFDEIIELIASLPTKVLLEFHPSTEFQSRIDMLLDRRAEGELISSEEAELEKILMLEHIVRMAKARALQKAQA